MTNGGSNDDTWNVPCNHNVDGSLCPVCNAIALVESEIEGVRARLDALYEKHRSLRTKRNELDDRLSRLPYDLSTHIMLLCVREAQKDFDPDDQCCRGFSMSHLPLKLGAVCRSWRHRVHSIPRLWSTISVDLYKVDLEFIAHAFLCSGSATLAFQLHVPNYDKRSTLTVPPHAQDVITLVKKNLHRMVKLCLELPCELMRAFCLQNLDTPSTLPILEELHLHCLSKTSFCEGSHDFAIFIAPPHPRKVVLSSSSLKNIQLDWDNVRHLALDSAVGGDRLEITDALSLLSKGRRLWVVDLYLANLDFVIGPPSTITQTSIRNLRLFGKTVKLLSHIITPHLESLRLWQTSLNLIHPSTFLRLSSYHLRTLDLRVVKMPSNSENFINIFQSTPELQQLFLQITTDRARQLTLQIASGTEILHSIAPSIARPEDWSAESHVARFLKRLRVVANDSRDSLLPLLQKFVYVGPMVHVQLHLFLDAIETRTSSDVFSTLGDSHATQWLEELIIYKHQPNNEFEPPTGSDLERIVRLDALGNKISVLKQDTKCVRALVDFSAYYGDDHGVTDANEERIV